MLVISRHPHEALMIGDSIRVTVIEIRGDKVRLGVDAPINLPVHRQEVYDAIQRAKKFEEPPSPWEMGDPDLQP